MSNTSHKGVLAADWAHWQKLGLTSDLLPVVSDPAVPKHRNSKIEQGMFSKTPSRVTRDGFAVGITDWPKKTTTDEDIGRWCQNRKHGILLMTGNHNCIIALDIDIDDHTLAAEVREYIALHTGAFPHRYRKNSGKFTQLVKVQGTFRKRSIAVRDGAGAIELLAKGQQTVIGGTHTSGVRYEWEGGLPTSIPEITPEQLEDLWAGLVETFGVGDDLRARGGMVRTSAPGVPNAAVDDISNFLLTNDWVKSPAPDGSLNISCPFKAEHTQESGESATRYFPPGVGRKEDGTPFARGHFVCKHAHCSGRYDGDFLDAIGYMAGEFEDLTGQTVVALDGTTAKVGPPPPPEPNYAGRLRNGRVSATVVNLLAAVRRPDQCSMKIAWDCFRDEIVWGSPDAAALDWQAFGDEDYMVLREHLERNNFMPIGRELIRDVVHKVAKENTMDSATLWAESLRWDGVKRVHEFFHTYFRAVSNPYTRAVSMYAWTALAGRALVPGIKADMAVILKSEQGTVKTEGIKAIAPHADAFGEIDLGKGDDALARQTRGKLVVEISELRGLNSREHGAIKSWVSRTHEEWVPKFKEFATKFPRRFICFGTTNEDEFLADATGERRWLPVEVGRTDIEALRRDCEQMWAEGVHLFKQSGIQWAEAERLARREHSRFKVQDTWSDIIGAWLDEEAFGQAPGVKQGDHVLRMHEVLQSAMRMNPQNITRREELRAARVLRNLGYESTVLRAGNRTLRGWVNQERLDAAHQAQQDLEDIG